MEEKKKKKEKGKRALRSISMDVATIVVVDLFFWAPEKKENNVCVCVRIAAFLFLWFFFLS